MKGLLIKDIRLLKGQSTILLALLVLVAVFMGVVSDVSSSFVVAYITIFPVTRKKYVNEKYIFGILISIFAWCVGMAAGTVLMIAQGAKTGAGEWIGGNLMYICIAWMFMSIMMPLRLRFDSEKARYANIIMFALIAAVAYGVSRISQYVPEDILRNVSAFFNTLGNNGILALCAVAAAAALLISYICSRHIMEKKEF